MNILLFTHIVFGSISLLCSLWGIKYLLTERTKLDTLFRILGVSFVFSLVSGIVLLIFSFSDGKLFAHCVGLGFYTAWIGSIEFLLWRKMKFNPKSALEVGS